MTAAKRSPTHLCVAVTAGGQEVAVERGNRKQCESAAALMKGWPLFVELVVRELNLQPEGRCSDSFRGSRGNW
jgi:hypothetical protein